MMNIQNEVQKIHNQYGMSEKANYKIQLLCEQYAKEYHDSEVKKLNIPAVVGQSEQLVCSCGCKKVKTNSGYECGNAKCNL
ncbi:MAG TPA: hypothetical protein VFC68_03160 [Treponemataceae bacterium]|nr:hypothetical protein [Treponemataceae bacterium]